MSSKVSLFAPVTGFISKVNVNRGQYINPNDVLFEIIDPGDNHLNLSVLENDLGALSVGQEVTCHPNNKPDKSYHARILLVNRSVGDDRSSEVHCHFEGTHPELAPGMFMNAEIAVVKKQTTAVPNDAIVRWQNKQYIFSAKSEQEFELIPVETGITDNDFTEILLPSLPEKIVVNNAYNILMKMKNSGE
jgi:cobalt-zinc-cadmium efflux system membrane fusion protein